ncbi:MAG: anthranilate synthase component I family protein [Candidatus Limnocylindrales bacterium]
MDVSETWTARRETYPSAGLPDLPDMTPFALLHGAGRWVILAEDPLAAVEAADFAPFRFERSGSAPPIRPDLVGLVGYGYDAGCGPTTPRHPAREPLSLPDFRFVLYGRVRVWDRELGMLYEGVRRAPRMIEPKPSLVRPGRFQARKVWDTDAPAGYWAKVGRIREEIARGNVYQVDLTRQEAWAYEGSLLSFAGRLAEADPAPRSAIVVEPDFAIIGASPESFLRIDGGVITTRPIKGTASRGIDPSDDDVAAARLLSSAKNLSELAMIVDLLRNDLARVCAVPSVRVTAFPELERYARVMHLMATVTGTLRPDITLEELLRATFPGGSITGCPKLAAIGLIRELEESPRGPYTGALGWFCHDLSQLDLSIVIRTVWADAREMRFGVGGGIVWDSDPADEYLETGYKAASLIRCLS